jgi:hypothetical protein
MFDCDEKHELTRGSSAEKSRQHPVLESKDASVTLEEMHGLVMDYTNLKINRRLTTMRREKE